MRWETPVFEEINMSAEIGGYQGDDGGGNEPPASTDAEAPSADASR
jgi:hypothetical protein